MDRPNIAFIVLDSARLKTATDSAPTLQNLGSENIWFENAIAPAGWSLPSHVSMFTGQYPHDHGVWSVGDRCDSLPLLERLNKRGYDTYGISANGFASGRTGFSESFGQFHSTVGQTVYPEGIDVNTLSSRKPERIRDVGKFGLSTFEEVATHDHPLKSAANVVSAAIPKLTQSFSLLERVPHPRFSKYVGFSYDPCQTTRMVERSVDDSGDQPFFIFANYMNTHHPYNPPNRYQRKYCGRTLSYSELREFNEKVHPLNHLSTVHNGGPLDEQTVQLVRCLYRGEVRSADDQLERILASLEEQRLLDNTLIVITADHGENLGEEDSEGIERFGHESAATDELLRVPLVVASPNLRQDTVTQPASLRNLFNLFRMASNPDHVITNTVVRDILTDEIVYSEFPAAGKGSIIEDEYPEIPSSLLKRHIACGYTERWKFVITSTGQTHGWKDGNKISVEDVPSELREGCERSLSHMLGVVHQNEDIDSDVRARLEELGYI